MTIEKTGQPVFVAGATGYIGGRLVPRLLDAELPGAGPWFVPRKNCRAAHGGSMNVWRSSKAMSLMARPSSGR